MKKRNAVPYILLGMGLILTMILGVQYAKRIKLQQGIADKVLRFHVLANSDSEKDQQLKLKVRDAIGAEMSELLKDTKSRQESEKVIRAQLGAIEEIAETVLTEEGCDYEVETFLDEVDFPVKTYGSYTFPAGRYEALEVVIGEGKGHNWWCVMYPNMCFSGSLYEVVDEESEKQLRQVLTPEEYEKVLTTGNYKIQFKYLSFLNQ